MAGTHAARDHHQGVAGGVDAVEVGDDAESMQHGRAVVVGSEHSHGKGTVQTVIDLDNTITNFLLSSLFFLMMPIFMEIY